MISYHPEAYNRGYMRNCYHKQCDNFNRENVKNISYNFLTAITEAVILTVIELSASGRSSKTELGGCEFSLEKDRFKNDLYKDTSPNADENVIDAKLDEIISPVTMIEKDENLNVTKQVELSSKNKETFANTIDRNMNEKSHHLNSEVETKSENTLTLSKSEITHPSKGGSSGNTVYSSGGGTQVNIGNLNIALSLPFDIKNEHSNSAPHPYNQKSYIHEESVIPNMFQEPTYTNIIDYLVKKVYNSNEYDYVKKDKIDAKTIVASKQKQHFKEKRRNKLRKKNSPMVVHILDDEDDIPYSVFNEIGDN